MYDFLLTEAFWMDTIISSIIAGISAIIGSIIVYQYNIRKIVDNTNQIPKNKEKMVEEHSLLSKEHLSLAKDHDSLSKDQGEIKQVVTKMNDILQQESAKSTVVMGSLSDTQKEIRNSMDKASDFPKMFDNVVLENIRLSRELEVVREENKSLEKKAIQLERDKNYYSSKAASLEVDHESMVYKLKQKIISLQEENDTISKKDTQQNDISANLRRSSLKTSQYHDNDELER